MRCDPYNGKPRPGVVAQPIPTDAEGNILPGYTGTWNGDGTPRRKAGATHAREHLELAHKAKYELSHAEPDEPGKNQKYVELTIRIQQIAQKANRKDVNSLRDCFLEYVKTASELDCRIGNFGAYTAMGINREDASRMRHGVRGEEMRRLMEMVDGMCTTYREQLANDNAINVAAYIFQAKNFDGMEDNPIPPSSRESFNFEEEDVKSIEDKYKGLLPD